MKFTILFFIFVSISNCFGQTCIHKDLSSDFDFITNIKRYKNGDFPDSCFVKVDIVSKKNKNAIQTIQIISDFLLGNAYLNCNEVRSYITLKNMDLEIEDNDFGDIIIADFNFDSIEDIAIKQEVGGNGGPIYRFYIQNDAGQFVLDEYLTNKMQFFPIDIDRETKTLTTLVHASSVELCKSTYIQDKQTNKWKRIKKSYVEY